MRKNIFLIVMMCAVALQGAAQKVGNVKAVQQGKQVIVSYKVVGGKTDRIYMPILYYSSDGGSSYNRCRSTKAKYEKPNKSAQITWNITNDLDYFGGSNIVFRIIVFPVVYLNGRTYKIVEVGKKTWLAENLDLDVGDGCWCYDNKTVNCKKYGRRYTWYAAKRAANEISGWHLPSDEEWKQLELYFGMKKSEVDKVDGRGNIAKKLKTTSGWKEGGNGNNTSGFSVLPAGVSYQNRETSYIGYSACFWTSSTTNYKSRPIWRHISTDTKIYRESHIFDGSERFMFSVRLIKD